MSPFQTLVYLAIASVFGVIGSLIGRPKGYPVWGFFMGAGLSLVGIVIITLWPPKKAS